MATVAELSIMINADTQGAERGIALVQDKLFRFAIGMGGIGATVGGAFTNFLTSAIDLETAMQNVNSIAQVSEAQIAEWTDRVQELGVAFGEDPVALAQGMYEIQSAGFAAADALDILASSAKAARAGLSDTATASDAVTSVLNSYRNQLGATSEAYRALTTEGERAEYIQNVLFRAVDRGKMTYDELAGSIGRVGAISASAGVTIEDVGAALAVMTQQGLNSDEAATALYNTINALIKPNQTMVDVLQSYGYESGIAAIETLGFVGVMDLLEEHTGGAGDEIAKLFSNIRGQRGATLLMSGDFAEMLDLMLDAQPIINDTTGEIERMGAMDLALAEQTKAASFGIERMRSAITAFGQDITQVFLAPIGIATNAIADLFAGFLKLPAPVKEFLGMIMGLTGGFMILAGSVAIFLAIIGPILGWIILATAVFVGLSSAIAGVVLLIKNFGAPGFIVNFFNSASDAASNFADSMALVASRVRGYWEGLQAVNVNSFSAVLMTIGAFFRGLAAEIPLLNTLDPILIRLGDGFVHIGQAIEKGVDVYRKYKSILKQVGTAQESLPWNQGISAFWQGDLLSGSRTVAVFEQALSNLHNWLRGIQATRQTLMSEYPQFAAFFDNLLTGADEMVRGLMLAARGDWSGAWEFFVSAASEALDALGDLSEQIFNEVESAIRNVNWANIRDIGVQMLTDVWNAISGTAIPWIFNTAIPTIGGWIASAATAAGAVWDFIVSAYPYLVGWTSDLINWTMDFAVPEVIGWIKDIGGNISDWIIGQLVSGGRGSAASGASGQSVGLVAAIKAWVLSFDPPDVQGWISGIAGRLENWILGYLLSGGSTTRGGAFFAETGSGTSLTVAIGGWSMNVLVPKVTGWVATWAGRLGDFISHYLYAGGAGGNVPMAGGAPAGSSSGGIIVTIGQVIIDVLNGIAKVTAADVQGWIQAKFDELSQLSADVDNLILVVTDPNVAIDEQGTKPSDGWFEGMFDEFIQDPILVEIGEWFFVGSGSLQEGYDPSADAKQGIMDQIAENPVVSDAIEWGLVLGEAVLTYDLGAGIGSVNDYVQKEADQWLVEAKIDPWNATLGALGRLTWDVGVGIDSINREIEAWLDSYNWDIDLPSWGLKIPDPSPIDLTGVSLPNIIEKIGDAVKKLGDINVPIDDWTIDLSITPDIKLPGEGLGGWIRDKVSEGWGILTGLEEVSAEEGTTTIDATAFAEMIQTAAISAIDALSPDTIGSAFQRWVARGLQAAPINAGPSSQIMLAKLDAAVGAQLSTFSGVSLGNGIQQWVARGLQAAPINAGPSAQALLEKLNIALVLQLGTFSGESLGSGIENWFSKAMGQADLSAAGLEAGTAYQQGLAEGLILAMASVDVHINLVNAKFDTFATDMQTSGSTAGQNYNMALTQGLRAADANAQIQLATIRGRMVTFVTEARTQGLAAGQTYNQGMTQGLRAAVANAQIQIAAIKTAMTFNAHGIGYTAGSSFGSGVAAGASAWVSPMYAIGQALAQALNAGFESISQPGSPSKLGIKQGGYYGEGVYVGVESWLARASMVGSMLANAVTSPMVADTDRFAASVAGGANRGTTVNNYFVVTPEELERMMKDSREGGEFARSFAFSSSAKMTAVSEA